MAFPTGWGRQCAITIDNTKVSGSGSHTDFPVLITKDNIPTEAIDAGSNSALNGGGDVRFSSDSAGTTQLACEVVEYVTNATAGNQSCYIWVKIPSLATGSDTTIYMWYSKTGETQPAVTDTYGRNAVWSSVYDAVFHLHESSGDWINSTGDGNDIPTVSSGITRDVDGQVGPGINYTGGSVLEPDSPDPGYWHDAVGSATWSIWLTRGDDVSGPNIAFHEGGTAQGAAIIYRGSPNTLHFVTSDNSNVVEIDSTTTIEEGSAWTHVCGVHDLGAMTLYVNGASEDTGTNGTTINYHSAPPAIGYYALNTFVSSGKNWNGDLQEARRAKSVLDADWIATEYNNQWSPSTFASAGTPATPSSGTTINAAQESLTITANGAAVVSAINIAATLESLSLTENQAVISHDITGLVESLSLSQFTASISSDRDISANVELLLLSPFKSDISHDVSGSLESLQLSTYKSDVGLEVSATIESLTLSSFLAAVSGNDVIDAAVEALTLTTSQSTISTDRDIPSSLETITMTVLASEVGYGVETLLESLTLSPSAASLSLDRTVSAAQESILLTELSSQISLAQNIDAGIEQLTLTPSGATITLDTGVSATLQSLTLTAIAASITAPTSTILIPGLEFTVKNNRLHFTIPVNKIHFTT